MLRKLGLLRVPQAEMRGKERHLLLRLEWQGSRPLFNISEEELKELFSTAIIELYGPVGGAAMWPEILVRHVSPLTDLSIVRVPTPYVNQVRQQSRKTSSLDVHPILELLLISECADCGGYFTNNALLNGGGQPSGPQNFWTNPLSPASRLKAHARTCDELTHVV